MFIFNVDYIFNGDLRMDVRAQKRRLSKAVSIISPVIQAQSLKYIISALYRSLSFSFFSDHFSVYEGEAAPSLPRSTNHHVGPPLDCHGVQNTEQSVHAK